METNQLYISRPSEGKDLYARLQQHTLDELERIAGTVWTDFNAHDPGITIADTANYALTEMDYKLSFSLEEYLTNKNGTYAIEEYGLFPSEQVYPTTPVTIDDYRKLLLAHFPMLENVKVEADKKMGTYNFSLRFSPYYIRQNIIEERVRELFHYNRNLCENIDKITIETPKALSFKADFEIYPDGDSTDILVQIYWVAMQYLSGSIKIEHESPEGFVTLQPEAWYEGPVEDVRVTIPTQGDTQHEIYWLFCKIKGVKHFKTCYFYENENEIRTDFKAGYRLKVPSAFNEITVRIRQEEVEIDAKRFKEKLQALYFTKDTSRTRFIMQEREKSHVQAGQEKKRKSGTERKSYYRDVYEHYPISKDLPHCYKRNINEIDPHTTDAEVHTMKIFGSYLKLFDFVMERGLNELDSLKRLLSLSEEDTNLSIEKTLPEGQLLMSKTNDHYRDITEIKNQYLDFLDQLYGVESNPSWMGEFGYYGETTDDALRRRMRFLKALPELTRNRSKAINILEGRNKVNVPNIKKHLSLLLNMNFDESVSVGNILPRHNLMLMGDHEEGKQLRDQLNSMLINEKILDADLVIPIEPDAPIQSADEKLDKQKELRRNLPIFNSNWISGGLFRQGIHLSNYKLVKLENGEFLLVFQHVENGSWMNLGRSEDKTKLQGWANTLRCYLQDLNRKSEAVYVLEKSFFEPIEPFAITFIFTGWTARTKSPRFRDVCTQLVRSLLPAHLKAEFHWLSAPQMQYFEASYHKWRDELYENTSKDMLIEHQKAMMKVISKTAIYDSNR